jgi:hypothetical protein
MWMIWRLSAWSSTTRMRLLMCLGLPRFTGVNSTRDELSARASH